jgi:hypothetical protein
VFPMSPFVRSCYTRTHTSPTAKSEDDRRKREDERENDRRKREEDRRAELAHAHALAAASEGRRGRRRGRSGDSTSSGDVDMGETEQLLETVSETSTHVSTSKMSISPPSKYKKIFRNAIAGDVDGVRRLDSDEMSVDTVSTWKDRFIRCVAGNFKECTGVAKMGSVYEELENQGAAKHCPYCAAPIGADF